MKYPFGVLAPQIIFPFAPPSIVSGVSVPGTGCDLGRKLLRVEDMIPYGYTRPPGDAWEVNFNMWRQAPYAVTGAADVTLGLDHNGRFLDECEFINGREYCDPRLLTNVGYLPLVAGASQRDRTPGGPWLYRPGKDVVCVCPEVAVSQTGNVNMFVGADLLLEAPLDLATGFIYAMPTLAETSGAAHHYRTRVPKAKAGNRVRVHIEAGSLGCNLSKASIGIQSGSGADTVATPVPLKWGGAAGPGYGAYAKGDSDWADLTVHDGDNLLITLALTNNTWPYRYSGIGRTWYSDTDPYATAVMASATLHPEKLTPAISAVEVMTV